MQIEEHVLHILSTEELYGRLSQKELEYAKGWVECKPLVQRLSPMPVLLSVLRYLDMVESHFNDSILDQLPEKFKSFTEKKADNNMSECSGFARADVPCVMPLRAHAVPEPDLDEFVFCRITEDMGLLQLDERCVQQQRCHLFSLRGVTVACRWQR